MTVYDSRTIQMCAMLGYPEGVERAFKLKLHAQIALCQVQIEANTRAAAEARAAA